MNRTQIFLLAVVGTMIIACATTNTPTHSIAGYPSNLPKGAKVMELGPADDGGVLIGIRGVGDILRVEIYGRGIEHVSVEPNGIWSTFVLPKGRWFNFIFRDSKDNLYHFVYVTLEDADMSPAWMDESITTFQPAGWGAAMTARKFKKNNGQ